MPSPFKAAAAALLSLAIVNSPLMAQDAKPMDRTVTVSATGTASAVPDEANIQTGVSSEAKTAREALSKNSENMRKVIAALKAKGIEAEGYPDDAVQYRARVHVSQGRLAAAGDQLSRPQHGRR